MPKSSTSNEKSLNDFDPYRHGYESNFSIPPRNRDESFDQPHRVNYLFDNDVPVCLRAIHDQRMIVVEIDVMYGTMNHVDRPGVSTYRRVLAQQLLKEVRKKLDGLLARVWRSLSGKMGTIQAEGPFLPFQPGRALCCLTITVNRDGNFDQQYKLAQKYLELHPRNQDRARLKSKWAKSKPALFRNRESFKQRPYQWSDEELRAVEQMARLEPATGSFDSDPPGLKARLRYNEIVMKQCRQKLHQKQWEVQSASREADVALRQFFSRR